MSCKRLFPNVDSLAIFIDMIAPKWPRAMHKLARFSSRDHRNTHGYWAEYLFALHTCSRPVMRSCPERSLQSLLFCVHFHVSVAEPFLMAEVPVPIPPDVLVAALPAAEAAAAAAAAAAAEVPAAGDNPVAPAEEVSWFLSLYCGCLLLASRSTFEMCGVCRLCYHGVCRLTSLFSWCVSPLSLFSGGHNGKNFKIDLMLLKTIN